MDDGVDERGLARACAPNHENVLMAERRLADQCLLAGGHGVRAHVIAERKNARCPLADAKARACHHRRDQPFEAAAVEGQLAFEDGIFAGDGGFMKGRDGSHGGLGPMRGHFAEARHGVSHTLNPEDTIGVQHDLNDGWVFETAGNELAKLAFELLAGAGGILGRDTGRSHATPGGLGMSGLAYMPSMRGSKSARWPVSYSPIVPRQDKANRVLT